MQERVQGPERTAAGAIKTRQVKKRARRIYSTGNGFIQVKDVRGRANGNERQRNRNTTPYYFFNASLITVQPAVANTAK